MADLGNCGNPERDAEQATIALKKGTQLIKYSRKGKPKVCAFRVSVDETTLIWYSHGHERNLKLDIVSKIIPGQRTAVFRKYPRPDKDYLSFSLVYNNGERSLDLICKDKVEADIWIAGLKALINTRQRRRSRLDGSDDGSDFIQDGRPFGASLEATSSISRSSSAAAFLDFVSPIPSSRVARSDVGFDRAKMQLRQSNGDSVRLSVSSAPSCSSHSSGGQDDIESLGDVYVWGEVWCDVTPPYGNLASFVSKIDVLLPKPLESNVVLDVHQIACGFRHAALITRQGEVFTWGEESGGRLGHGPDVDISRPRLVESLAAQNMDYVACGEHHTCAVSLAGDLFSWGDGTLNAGLLGHGTDISHQIPKRVCGPLEGLQVLSVSCGTWHSALTTSSGKLFTFGDGSFGALGHGDHEMVPCPREVESLSGLKTVKVACGVYHTAAIVEVMGQAGLNIVSRKLFTWGDGDKYRLGHGDKEPRLVPTCVSSLIDYNFHQLACGDSMTVSLTTSGHIFTMGSPIHGQLGNPQSDGKIPCLVQDKLVGELVEEISCGAFHVAALTSRSEVFTWGKGANGRLGHGDVEDRKTPTLVEALKDRHVKSISCGSSFTASICIHKWVSSADQSLCSGCRQAFGFTRKRHNCYNCGLVHCHACSSKKALKAALAPTPGKPHRVCDSCYSKLKSSESGSSYTPNRRNTTPRGSIDNRERIDHGAVKSSRVLLSPNTEPVKYIEVKSVKQGAKLESISLIRVPQLPFPSQLKDIAFPSSFSALQTALKPIVTPPPQQPIVATPLQQVTNSRPASPYSRRPSPPRSATPVFSSRSVIDSLKKTNELLNQEVLKLQAQVKDLKQRCDLKDVELQRLEKKAGDATSLAAEESTARAAAKELVKHVASQLKDVADNLTEAYDTTKLKEVQTQLQAYLKANTKCASQQFSSSIDASEILIQERDSKSEERIDDPSSVAGVREGSLSIDKTAVCDAKESVVSDTTETRAQVHVDNGPQSPKMSASKPHGGELQVIEQFEPGVYVTLVQLRNGTRVFKRVRFSKRRFNEHQAEEWWKDNKERVYKKYNYRGADAGPSGAETGNEPSSNSAEQGNDADSGASRPESSAGLDGAAPENDTGSDDPEPINEGDTASCCKT